MMIPQKLNSELQFDPAIPLVGVYPKELNQELKQIFVHPFLKTKVNIRPFVLRV